MRGNVCDEDSGTICWRSSTVIVFTCYQGKVQEGQFDDFPTGYRDIPGTNPAWVIVVGKIGAGNVTTSSINGFSRRGAGWKKGIFQLLFWFLTADKRIQANRNWKCVANEHLRYHIFTKNENSSWLKQRQKLLIKMQTCKTNIYTYHHLSPESGRQLQQIQRTNMWTRVST